MAEFWNHLVNTALLGTDKQVLDLDQLPESIKNTVSNTDATDREAFLLKTASLAIQFLKAGKLTPTFTLPEVKPCEPEPKNYSSVEANLILKKIIGEEDKKVGLLEMWLDKCIEQNRVVSHDMLVNLLNWGSEKSGRELQEKIGKVAGVRGYWLIQFNPAWKYLQVPDAEEIWNEGKPNERKEVFENNRKKDPQSAINWLEKSWNTETGKDKKDFLSSLEIGLSKNDEPFLIKIFDESLTAKTKEKAINQEIRGKIAALLLAIPGSKFSEEIWDKLKIYFKKKTTKKLLGLKTETAIELQFPIKGDDFLNKETMWSKFALLETSQNLEWYEDTEAWLYELIRYTHPEKWADHLELTMEEIFLSFNENENFTKTAKGKTLALYTMALADAAYLHKNEKWAVGWVNYFKTAYTIQNSNASFLYEFLPQADLESFYQKHIDLNGNDYINLRNVLVNKRLNRWSISFTRYVFNHFTKRVQNYYQVAEDVKFIEKAILYIHPDILNEIDKMIDPASPDWQKTYWLEKVVIPVTRIMEIKQEIDSLK